MSLEAPAPQAIAIFGATGDLAKKKILPALYNLARESLLPERHVIIGFGRSDWDDETFRARAREAVEEFSSATLDEEVWKHFAASLSFVRGSFEDPAAMADLAARLMEADERHGCDGGRLYYLAVPPQAFPIIVKGLGEVGGNTPNARIVIEKPFGHSLKSARELAAQIHEVFDESQVFRIDHYLGKETVQNLVIFRFANSLFERVWNRDAIDHIQVTVAESIGVEGRAGYYDQAGAIRDLLQNHMLQMLAFLTMEPPRALEPGAFRDETAKLLKAIRPIDPADVVRGQYEGYRSEPGVDPASETESFVTAKVHIENWRWDGVPVYLRHGKKLPKRSTEIAVFFRDAPRYLLDDLGVAELTPDHLTVRVQPDEGISLAFQAKVPGPGYELETVRMDFDYGRSFMKQPAEAYERLLHDAMDGDHTLFTRQDGVERSWEIVEPILMDRGTVHLYAPGSWGPPESDLLIAPRQWHLGRGGKERSAGGPSRS
ncbi:MAG TPA: glucose-6-phosphate dehydrogenase [Actinomycetota bacterium]|jgi:glucose-6-phosphate 1-dehydrogenase|nr:glucose-6-phosphate dehydrogenase [Actinomycetota bacterium]